LDLREEVSTVSGMTLANWVFVVAIKWVFVLAIEKSRRAITNRSIIGVSYGRAQQRKCNKDQSPEWHLHATHGIR